MARTFQIPAQITSVSIRGDRSARISATTDKEVSSEDMTTLMSFIRNSGWFLFRENAFNHDDVPAGDAPDGRKTQSQRLRNVLYRVFELTGKPASEFNAWCTDEMERIITHYKKKLD